MRGFSLIELVVVVVIISLLLVIAISRLLAIQVDAERVAMQTVVGTLRSALGMQVAEHIVRHRVPELVALVGTNPMEHLAEVPGNYLGVLANPDPGDLESGNWYFDTGEGTLVYLVRHSQYFESALPRPARARFAIELVFRDANGNGVYDLGADKVEGLRIAALEPYRWTN